MRLPTTLAALTLAALALGCGDPPASTAMAHPPVGGGEEIPIEYLAQLELPTVEDWENLLDSLAKATDELERQVAEPGVYLVSPAQMDSLSEAERDELLATLEKALAVGKQLLSGNSETQRPTQ